MIPPRIKNIEVLEDFKLKIIYVTEEIRIYDMKKNFKFDYYKKLKNFNYFQTAKAVDVTIEWPDGEDIDPNELYNNSVLE